MTATIEDRLVIGDASVLQEIYAHHASLIHTIAYQLQGPAADQFTISTFVEAWRNRRDFDPSKGTVQAWLIRRLRSQLSNNDDYAAEVIDRVVVTASLARMDSTRREILLAGAVSGTGATAELAQQLNLPVGTAKVGLRRGMEALQSELADSRSDGDASSLADIVRSRRLETEVVRPDPAVWDAIRSSAADDAGNGADVGGSDVFGGVVGEDVPDTPDPFEPLRPDQGPSSDRRRALVELEADESGSIEADEAGQTVAGDAVDPDVVTSDATSRATGGSRRDPTVVSDDWDGGGVDDNESMLADSMVHRGDQTNNEADGGFPRSILESSDQHSDDEHSHDDQDRTVDFGPTAPTGSDPGPITETDWAVERMRPPMEDAPPDRPNMVTVAGVVVALIVLVVLFLIVL